MPTHIRLQPQQISNLAAIRDLGAAALHRVVVHLRDLTVPALRPEDLHKHVVEALDGDERAAEDLLGPVLALYQIIRQRQLSIDEVFEGLRNAIDTTKPSWSESETKAWNSVEP